MSRQAVDEVPPVKAFAKNAIQKQHGVADLVLQGVVYDFEIVFRVENVEVFYDLLVSDVALAEAGGLVEDGQRVAHSAVCLLRNQFQSLLLVCDAFLLRNFFQMVDGVGDSHSLEVVDLTARQDGRQYLVLFGRGQDENHVCGWFFQRFQKRVEGRRRKHVYLVDDENLVASHLWRNAGLLHQRLDVFHGVVAGRIQFKDVERPLLIERLAAFATVASLSVFGRILAIDGLCENSRTGRLSYAAWAAEQVGVGELSAFHRIF